MNKNNPFHELSSVEKASEWKKRTGGQVIGYLCTYAPVEIIHAAGALPYRIFGTGSKSDSADRHLQAYACSLVRSALGEALDGDLNFLDGAVFPHTCDSIQRLSDIWRLNAGMTYHFDVVLPVKLNTPSARNYMLDVLTRFRKEISASLGIEITDEKLSMSIKLYNRLRQMLTRLYEIRKKSPMLLSGADIFAALRASMTIDPTEFSEMLESFLNHLKKEESDAPASQPAAEILLTGGVCDHPDIYSIIENSDARVVWDDLCSGSRSFAGQIDENIAPLEALTERYYERIECPAKHKSPDSKGEQLKALIKESGARGVIILQLKFCDPHAFDYPFIKETLDEAGIPSLLLEIEDPSRAVEASRTRIETFIEMIR